MRGSARWVKHASKHPSRKKRRRRFSERCCPGSREVFTATESTPRLARMTTDSAPRPITLWRRTPSMEGAWASEERVVESMEESEVGGDVGRSTRRETTRGAKKRCPELLRMIDARRGRRAGRWCK